MMLYTADGDLRAAISADGGRSWRDDRTIQTRSDGVRVGRPTALVADDGAVHVFYFGFERYTRDPATSRSDMWTTRSNDGGRTWTDPQRIWSGYTGMTEPPIQLGSGRILLPLGYLVEPGRYAACVVRSDDGGRTWTHNDGIALPHDADADARARRTGLSSGAIEPVIAPLGGDRVVMLVRTIAGRFWRSVSSDGGATWSALEAASPTCGGPGVLHTLADGRLMMIWNPADASAIEKSGYPHGFASQRIALSADGGRTWNSGVEFIRHETRVVHSVALETEPGKLLITVPGHGLLLNTTVQRIEGAGR
jgi:hypothetical protein